MNLATRLASWFLIAALAAGAAWPYAPGVRGFAAEHLVRDQERYEALDGGIRGVHDQVHGLYAELRALVRMILPPQYLELAPPGSPAPFEASAEARALFDRANEARREHGLAELAWDDGLARVATGHSQDMVDHNFFAHESSRTGGPMDRCAADEDVIWRFQGCGENLARTRNVDEAHQGLMESPGHRENILQPGYTHLGVGVVVRPDGFRLYTQKFGVARPADETRVVLFAPRLGQQVTVQENQVVVRGRARRSGATPVVWIQPADRPQLRNVFQVDGHFELTLPLNHGEGTYLIYTGQQSLLQLRGAEWARVHYQP